MFVSFVLFISFVLLILFVTFHLFHFTSILFLRHYAKFALGISNMRKTTLFNLNKSFGFVLDLINYLLVSEFVSFFL